MPDERLPRYQRLRDEIAEKIAGHLWRPGDLIPTEVELAAAHGIAIGTVRKAVDALVADGLIERQQGRGTYVRRPQFNSSLFRFFRFDGVDRDVAPRSRLLEREAVSDPPEEVSRALRLNRRERAIRLLRLRLLDEKPFLREEIWLPHARFAPLLTADEAEIGDLLYPAYERICGEVVGRAEEVLTVGAAGSEDARLLELEFGEPVVVIERLAFGFGGQRLEWRRSHGLAWNFRYKVEIH